MRVAFGLPWLLLLLPPVLGLVWWWYRRRRPPERRVAGLWLWQKALRKGRARRRFDLRLFLLLLSAL
ncbi:MAG: BatA domain-containing protein, partial [Meiothermus sp.]